MASYNCKGERNNETYSSPNLLVICIVNKYRGCFRSGTAEEGKVRPASGHEFIEGNKHVGLTHSKSVRCPIGRTQTGRIRCILWFKETAFKIGISYIHDCKNTWVKTSALKMSLNTCKMEWLVDAPPVTNTRRVPSKMFLALLLCSIFTRKRQNSFTYVES